MRLAFQAQDARLRPSWQFLAQKLQERPAAGVLCAIVLCCLLIFGLWPFGHPRNDVTWFADQNIVRIGKHGTILSAGPLPGRNVDSCSIEIWVRPALSEASSTLLAFFGPSGLVGLSLHQSLTDLRLDDGTRRSRPSKMYIGDVLRAGRLVFLTVVSGPHGTAVYVDGVLARENSGFRSSHDACADRFVLGDAPDQHDTWEGELGGLAIYRHDLTAQQVLLNYQSWRNTGRPAESGSDKPDALYLFNEGGGRLVHDHGSSGVSLYIPQRYIIAQQILLESPWRAFEPTWNYIEDIFINIFGFVPFGFALCAFLAADGRVSRVGAITVLAGLLVSLSIEVLQAHLPTRNSDLTDILTNTLGTCFGVLLQRKWRLAPSKRVDAARQHQASGPQ